ncbi:MAG TPA: ribosomal-protein-alanine N-acetyltransferase [Clostridiales bacterium]|nr:ribosomal-protein-alanine N-acetyltransferase [Clostridiales bacterium]
MSIEIAIRRGKEADAPAIAMIEAMSFKTPWSTEMVLSEMKEAISSFFVVEYQDKIIGYYGFLHILDELHILNVAVDPDHRRQGVGRQLMAHLVEQARALSARAITLEVRESNLTAIRLYERAGFQLAGVRPHYYTDKENALIYWLEL